MDTFYKELLKLKEESEGKSRELADWKQKLGQDLLNFYKKYDTQASENQVMTKAERDSLNQLVAEMSDNISKSKYLIVLVIINIDVVDQKSIQLLAKESKEAFENVREDIDRVEQRLEETSSHSEMDQTTVKNKVKDLVMEVAMVRQAVQSRDLAFMRNSMMENMQKAQGIVGSVGMENTKPAALASSKFPCMYLCVMRNRDKLAGVEGAGYHTNGADGEVFL
jgi:hypothetical protein